MQKCLNREMDKVEVLCATMHQKDFSNIEKMNIQTDALFANQDNRYSYNEKSINGNLFRMITTPTVGVGVNRNVALIHAQGEYCLFADDDVTYFDGYEETIKNEFTLHPDADGIVFRFEYIKDNQIYNVSPKIKGNGRGSLYNLMKYGTYALAVKRQTLLKKNIWFSELFGGGCLYGSGEDSLFLLDMLKTGCKIYRSNEIIGVNVKDESSWFTGYNAKYFFDKGAFIKCAYPHIGWLMKWYYILFFRERTDISKVEMYKEIKRGMQLYEELKGYTGQ